MQPNSIKCPHCGESIDINSVLYHELQSKVKKEYLHEVNRHRQEYKKAKDELKAKELFIKLQQSEFEQKLNLKVNEKLIEQRAKQEEQIKKQLELEHGASIEKLKKEIDKKSHQLKELNESKIEIEKLKREKDELAQEITLKSERELNEKLKEEKEKILKVLSEENELKIKQKDEQINQIKRQLDEAKRKTEQGSMQVQGEAGELVIEEWLMQNFPLDEIQEIKKGQRGGDCLQIVNTREMIKCGTIYYESKITKEFQPSWIAKFKSDMIEKGVDVGVLVTATMPNSMSNMGLVDGVWVCNFSDFKALCGILREHIIKLAYALKSNENKTDKMSLLYSYLTSNEFSMQIEAIVSGFTQMQIDLDSEKRAMMRIWKQREKQITQVLENTTGMYGSIKGITGNAIKGIQSLELPYEQDD